MSNLIGTPVHLIYAVMQSANAYDHADTGQALQLMFTSNIIISVILTVAWFLALGGLV